MPREIVKHRAKNVLYISDSKRAELDRWLLTELTDAFSARNALESNWRSLLRKYEGIPLNPVNNFPIENAPNIEIPIGAIAVDSLFAQVLDLIFSTSPLVTCRPIPKMKEDKEAVADAKAMQRWVNWMATNELSLRAPVEEHCLDNIQLGTGIYYVPFAQRIKKTKHARIITRKPKIIAMPPEDVIVTGGSYDDPEDTRVLGLRFWLTKGQLADRAKRNNWDISKAAPAGAVDWVRQSREGLARQQGAISRKGKCYDIFDVYCYFDIDDDGFEEELYVVYSMTGQASLKVQYNPYDILPVVKSVYQRRAHLFWGLGVMEMLSPFQEELSNVHNYQTLNMLLANTRLWKGVNLPDDFAVWPNKVVNLRDTNDLEALQMADVYNSIENAQATLVQLAEKRVGVNELSNPRASAVMGNRTPGITALSLLQQINKRFTSAFDGMRRATSDALKQCVYRYQEELLAGNRWVEVHFLDVLGAEDGQRVLRLLRDERFEESLTLEMTASSASINKEADRQDAMMLVSLLSSYYQRTLELVAIAANQQTPPEVRSVARKIAESAGEVIDRTIRTFDQVRDPSTFIINIEEELNSVDQGVDQQALQGLMQLLGGGLGGGTSAQLPSGPEMMGG